MFKSVFKTGIRAAYNVSDNPSFVSEPWHIYPAKHKTTGRVVSVFIFDKSKFESQIYKLCQTTSNAKNPKVIISECYGLIKFEVSQLSKLRHPQILTIFEVLEETKSKFIFVSESVTNNLSTISIRNQLDELSIQKGLLQISKSLQFLHNNCSIIHFNLQPSSVFTNSQGDWKLSGFKFLQNLNEISPQERESFYIMNNSSLIPFANLNLNFTAPELLVDNQSKLDFANDIWSLGCLIYYLYNDGDLLINCFDSNSIPDYKAEFKKFENKFYNHRPSELKYLLKDVPEKLYSIYPQLLARYPNDRISIDNFIDSEFFNGSLIKAMLFVDEFSTKSLDEKLIFMRGLLEIGSLKENLLSQFPTSFKTSKLLPLLIDLIINELNVLNNKSPASDVDDLIYYSLSVTFKIGSTLSSLTFQDRIYESLLKDDSKSKKPQNIFNKLINSSVKARLTIIENLTIIGSRINDKQLISMVKHIINLVLTSSPLESTQQEEQIKLQELFLRKLPAIIEKFDFPYIKNTLLPTICQVFKTTTILSTKLLTIESFEMVIDKRIIDKVIVNEQLIPILKNLKSRDKRIVNQVLHFFVKLCDSEHISLELDSFVESVLPQCLSLTFGCIDCDQSEFKEFISLVNKIQNNLIERKLNSLTKTPIMSDANANVNFQSLINTQRINDGNKDSILRAPHSKNIMQPTKKPLVDANSKMPLKRSPISTPKVQPLNLKQKSPNKSPLTFGATNGTSNNNDLLSTLHNSLKNSTEEDDFEEFQQAKSGNSPVINWDTEINKSQLNNITLKPTVNSIPSQSTSINVLSNPKSTTNNNYPPGFNSNIVLTPTNVSKPKDPNSLNSKNAGLLDFL